MLCLCIFPGLASSSGLCKAHTVCGDGVGMCWSSLFAVAGDARAGYATANHTAHIMQYLHV